MNTVARAHATPVRAHAGWLWAALVLHALGAALVQFGNQYVSIFESRLDWLMRLAGLSALALGLIQISALLVRRVAGAEIVASMRRRMLLATFALGLLGAFFPNRDLPNLALFGVLIGLAWRKWTRGPLLWLAAAGAAALLTNGLKQATTDLLRSLVGSLGFPGNYLLSATCVGLLWSLLAGCAFALLITFAPGDSLERWREDTAQLAELLPFPRLATRLLLALALAGGLWLAYAQGRQNCRWLDRMTGGSGCVGTLDVGGASFDPTMAFSQDGATLLVAGGDDIAIYDFPRRELLQAWQSPDRALIESAAINADGSLLAITFNDRAAANLRLVIYRRGETTPFQSIALDESFAPALGFALDNRSILVDQMRWDIAAGTRLGKVDAATRPNYRTASSRFNRLSPDGSLSVRTAGADLSVYRTRYDGSVGERLSVIPDPRASDPRSRAFSWDNALLATDSRTDPLIVGVWRTDDGSPAASINLSPLENADVEGLAFSPDSRYLLVARQFQDNIEIYRLP